MPSQVGLSARFCETVKPPTSGRKDYFDSEPKGLALRVWRDASDDVRKVWSLLYRVNGVQRRYTIGAYSPALGLKAARKEAYRLKSEIALGKDPGVDREVARQEQRAAVVPDSVEAVVENFLTRHVGKKAGPDGKPTYRLRAGAETARIFDVYVIPQWRGRAFVGITRGDVSRLLDRVEDRNGVVMADRVLAAVSKLASWYATRNDDYSSPIVRGMRRSKPKERARTRVLSDDELRVIWPACSEAGAFGAFVQVSLLNAQRRSKVAEMRWPDIAEDGTWTIPTEKGEKSNAGELVLPTAALEIIKGQPEIAGNPYVFAGRGAKPMVGFSALKPSLDAKVGKAAVKAKAKPVAPWTLHDLRRTAKSLMARAGVRPDLSERVLGHTIAGVEGVYDRHDYRAEKAAALKALAELIARIVNPPSGNVVALNRKS